MAETAPESALATITAPSADEVEAKRNAELAMRWLKEIKRRRSREAKWREKARKTVARYRDDRDAIDEVMVKFNILWANTEVLKPAIFARMPVPDVRRRYLTKDPVARTAAMILERALTYCIGSYDFKDTLDRALEDYLLPGRGQCVVCYKPYFKQSRKAVEPFPDSDPPKFPEGTLMDAEGGYQMEQEKLYEEVYTEYQPWDFYVFGEATQRCRVPWEAYGERLSKAEVKEQYPDFADYETLSYSEEKDDPDMDGEKSPPKITIWKLWHKLSRKMMVFADGYMVGPIEPVAEDPLQLENFFPSPEPLYAIRTNGDDTPKPEFLMYQDQAIELDILVNRQRQLASALKYRGVYDKRFEAEVKLGDITKAPDNTFIPVPNYADLAEKGGLASIIDVMPIEVIQKVLEWLGLRIDLLKQEIYEVYGISDIVRGTTKASETLGAQQLKAQYAGMRISTRQERFQRFIRDILRIKAEIIAEHFSPQTLQIMTGIDVLPDEAYAQMKEAEGIQPNQVSQSEFLQACALIKNDKLRGFKIDIETDSTIPADREMEQKNRIDFMTAVGTYLNGILPAVQSGAIPMKLAREGMLFVVRGFKVGTELEEVLEELGQNSDEADQLAQLKQMQAQMAQELEVLKQENAKLKSDAEVKQAAAATDIDISQKKAANDIEITRAKAATDIQITREKAATEMRLGEQRGLQELTHKERSAHSDRDIKAGNALQDRDLKGQNAQQDGELKRRNADQDSEIKARGADQDMKTKGDAADFDLNAKKLSQSFEPVKEGAHQAGESKKEAKTDSGALDAIARGIEALSLHATSSRPKVGKMKGPSGSEYTFEMGEQ